MYGYLVGLSSNDVAYVEKAAAYVEITASGKTVIAEIINNSVVSNKGLDVVCIKFYSEYSYRLLKSKITKLTMIPVYFVIKHSYFCNVHKSLDKLNSEILNCLSPIALQPEYKVLPHTPYAVEDFPWLDKEYQLLTSKKLMACGNNAPFLLTGPIDTGKSKVLAAAAIAFLKIPSHRVLICTSHLHSADAYIDNYFGPMTVNHTMPDDVNPVRLVAMDDYEYPGKYKNLFKNILNHQDILNSRLIITTFLTAPQLINVGVKYFIHILIDEGALTCEPEAIAPLVLADDNAKIVIAGDHLQVRHYYLS